MRSAPFKITLRLVLLAIVIGVVAIVVCIYWSVSDMLVDVYAPAGAADLVIEHMEANDGAWPRDWDELNATFLSLEQDGTFRGFHWEEYRQRVGIDFAANPADLATAKSERGAPPFRVIWSTSHPDARTAVDPNVRLSEYLRHNQETDAE